MRPEDQHQPDELTALELRIQQAADLVVPSDTLRGRIVGEALRRHRDEQTDRKILRYGFTLLLASVCCLPSQHLKSDSKIASGPSHRTCCCAVPMNCVQKVA